MVLDLLTDVLPVRIVYLTETWFFFELFDPIALVYAVLSNFTLLGSQSRVE